MCLEVLRMEQKYEIMTNEDDCNYLIMSDESYRFSKIIPASELALICDWDQVFTMPGNKNNSWQAVNNAFSKVGSRKDILLSEKMAKKYYAIKKERFLTDKEIKYWQRKNLEMYLENGLRLECLEKEIKKIKISIHGATLLKYLLESGSKVCIISSGVKNVIEGTLESYGIDPKEYENLQINATKILFDLSGTMSGWDDQSIVMNKNKPWVAHIFSKIWDIEHENIFVISGNNTGLNIMDLLSKEATMIYFCPAHEKKHLTMEKFELIYNKAHGFAKGNFELITDFFLRIIEA
ncbi:MAG: hypothetical protein PHI45_01265 [Candidatus Pacebacteria bacterium]|nr:hypothetical protein [Candidatus Paceibacterota bacterium]MDD5013223.1 hypothetical protein [Candidatus Paceibacterota bacterium]MDD5752700.1 hypothetical protein [Candidatus Paceibacterota bacterium]